jgi:hypothetical protein
LVLRKDNVIERQTTALPDGALAERAQPGQASLRCSTKRRCSATNNADSSSAVAYTRNKRDSHLKLKRPPLAAQGHKETSMTTYFTIADFILIIPMALAGALFVGALPCKTELRHNVFRLIGALLGVGIAVLLVEGLPALV